MNRYPKPSDVGGTIIRKLISLFKENQIELPLKQPVMIAVSGGVDSMCLAHLLGTYGRRVIHPELITLIHFDHQWRVESRTVEKKAVKNLALQLGVGFRSVKLKTQSQKPLSKNLEEDARLKRNAFYAQQSRSRTRPSLVLTAHHADDVVETLVWRFFRGELFEQSEGILFKDNNVLRPFLKVTKEEIYAYVQAEKVPYFEDPGNQNSARMRAVFRTQLKPILLKQFPGFRNSVLRYAALRKSDRK